MSLEGSSARLPKHTWKGHMGYVALTIVLLMKKKAFSFKKIRV